MSRVNEPLNPTEAHVLQPWVAHFNLQGILGDLKQREWWQKNYPDPKYSGDYRVAGTIHALAWAILTFLPFCQSPWYALAVAVNAPTHYFIDDAKANRHIISLCEDQAAHLVQIGGTAASSRLSPPSTPMQKSSSFPP